MKRLIDLLSGDGNANNGPPIQNTPPPDLSARRIVRAPREKKHTSPVFIGPLDTQQEELKQNVLKKQKNRESLIASLNADAHNSSGTLGPTMGCYFQVPTINPIYASTSSDMLLDFQPITTPPLDKVTMPSLSNLASHELALQEEHRQTVLLQEQNMRDRLKKLPGKDDEFFDYEEDGYEAHGDSLQEDELEDSRDENDPSLVAEEQDIDAHILSLLNKFEKSKTGGEKLTAAEKLELDETVLGLAELPALTVDFLDIGQGDSTLFVCDDGTTMMIDLGSVNSGAGNEAVKDSLNFLAKTLHTQMIKRDLKNPCIDRFYITHCDQDHYNLLPALYKAVEKETGKTLDIKQFFVTEDPKEYTQDKTVFEGQSETAAILKSAKSNGRLVCYEHDYGGDKKAEPLNEAATVLVRTLCANSVQTHDHKKTSGGTESARNMSSIVVLVEILPTDEDAVGRKILMMGDAESVVENKLLHLHPGLIEKATILHVGHHGSKNSAQVPFIKKVDPQVAQYSADMKFQHPYQENTDRFLNTPDLRINEPMEGGLQPPLFGRGQTVQGIRAEGQNDNVRIDHERDGDRGPS